SWGPRAVGLGGAGAPGAEAAPRLLLPPFALAGNKERGWNDPPQFSYGLQTQAGGPKRAPLTRRAPAPAQGAPPGQSTSTAPVPMLGCSPLQSQGCPESAAEAQGAPPGAPPHSSALAASATLPPKSLGPPPLGPVNPALWTESVRPAIEEPSEDCDVPADAVLIPLREALDACRPRVQGAGRFSSQRGATQGLFVPRRAVGLGEPPLPGRAAQRLLGAGPHSSSCRCFQKQVCDDIGRRLMVLEDAWAQGKLSAPVRKRMNLLVQELQQRHWDTADEIHRSLMVDHVNEVSQWLVGVKRLIAEMRILPTVELAEPRDDETETMPDQEAA
ncbi:steroid receptor RNA activator 1, partial [Apteryx rowi]|uniref:steroid receptor RNA activator 1 n=1 Tax=Apteryx rowi TaxID=308060 RepID=UPI000E1D750D